MVRCHKGWIFGPFLFTLVASVIGVYLWPDSYVSCRPWRRSCRSRCLENMVQSAINQQMNDRINSMCADHS